MDPIQQMKSNIWKYYLAVSLAYFAFYTPIIQLFYLAHGFTIFKIATLGIVWTITKIILEVPSSIIADKFGRKKVLILSSLFAISQMIMLIYATEYWQFILASACSAASLAFLSGTDIAFFYDTLKILKKEDEFDKLWARQQIYQQIPLLIAFGLSSFLYIISPLLPFQLSLAFLILSVIVMLTFTEPKYHKPVEEVNVFTHFKQSVKFIFANSYLKAALLFTILFCIGSDNSYYYGQVYLNYLEFPIALFGVAYVFKSILNTAAANFAPSLRRRFSFRSMFGFQIIAITILFYIMVFTKNYIIGAIAFVLFAIPYGFFEISKSSYVHQHIQSHQRATVDSVFSLFVALTYLITEPTFGYLADMYTIKFPYLLIAITLSIYCIYYLFYGHKRI